MARLCVSIPVHEQLPVVVDQLDNFRAFLPPDTVIVIHLAAGFSDPVRMQTILPEGIYANPVSLPTRWGNVMDQHAANFRFASEIEEFDYFVLHASNDAFFAKGAERYLSGVDALVQRYPIDPSRNSPELEQLARTIGAERIYNSQVEGTAYRKDLFAEMVELVERHWRPNPAAIHAPEEWWYPTIAHTLTGSTRPPYVYCETHRHVTKHEPTPALLRALRDGRYAEEVRDDDQYLSVSEDYQENDFNHVFAVKRVPRVWDDPLRTYVRSLSREAGPRLRLRAPVDVPPFVAVGFAEEALARPELLKGYREAFSAGDGATLILWVPQDARAPGIEPRLVDACERAGLMEPGAPDVTGLVLPVAAESELVLAGIADVYCGAELPAGPFSELIHVKPEHTRRLRRLAELAAKAPPA